MLIHLEGQQAFFLSQGEGILSQRLNIRKFDALNIIFQYG